MKTINPVGGTKNPNRVGDVIFVHGLNGDHMKSWSYNDSKDGFWLGWLAEDCPDLGVWSIGYQVAANAWGGGHAMPLFDRATNILEELMVDDILGNKPVCFVTHSMGGLLVKRMLYTAHTIAPRYRRLMDTVCGLIFLATPHTGSDVAGIVNCLSLVFRPTDAVRDLEPHAPPLREMNIWYRQQADSLHIQTKVYVEGERMGGKWIVDPDSSDPAVPNVMPIWTDANHINIAKPPSRDQLVYRGCKQFVREVLSRQNVSTNQVKGQAGHDENVLSSLSQTQTSGPAGNNTPIDLFISHAQRDKELLDQLVERLANLRNQGIIHIWHSGDIIPGTETKREIQRHLDSARIILLLISPSYMASDFPYNVEMRQAIEKYKRGTARVLPILLRPTDYDGAPFAKLAMLPDNNESITTWPNRDEAFQHVVQGIKVAIKDLSGNP